MTDERMTVKHLEAALREMRQGGLIDDATIVCADSDEEGNSLNALRPEVAYGELVLHVWRTGGTSIDGFRDTREEPAKAICFGVTK